MTEHIRVTLDLYAEVDEEEFNLESGNEKDATIPWSEFHSAIVEQIEEAVKESGNGSSINLSFAVDNTQVERRS